MDTQLVESTAKGHGSYQDFSRSHNKLPVYKPMSILNVALLSRMLTVTQMKQHVVLCDQSGRGTDLRILQPKPGGVAVLVAYVVRKEVLHHGFALVSV